MKDVSAKRAQEAATALQRIRLTVSGIVQGVGFRPFVFRLAEELGLTGWVRNTEQGVVIELQGEAEGLGRIGERLRREAPPLARITAVERESVPLLQGESTFEIAPSQGQGSKAVLVPPDVATCPDCRRETLDPTDRHYRYPFTNCTHCGPRFTIVRDLPYDRPKTTMAAFPFCSDCAAEYHDPRDRRFHAQPVACPDCGPTTWLVDGEGRPAERQGENWDAAFRRAIAEGAIVAVKGLGGFHLACDATSAAAVARLRERKRRPAKPLAVMARNLEVVRRYCRVDAAEEELLTSLAAPIVLLERREDGEATGVGALPENLAPGVRTLGVMLPYTPLHILLFEGGAGATGSAEPAGPGAPDVLVMTSGNRSDLPIVIDNEVAFEELGGIADYFLLHNREIYNRTEDSLVRRSAGRTYMSRRSRGYVPAPIAVPVPEGGVALGLGAEMKNTFCLLKGKEAFLGPHVGEIDSVEAEENYLRTLGNFERLIDVEPVRLGYDLHPSYRISGLAQQIPAEGHEGIQHHHAHMAATMADCGLEGPVLAAVLDGTGYGPDGALWGFEILSGDYRDYRRHAHLGYARLPGGEQAIRRPWAMALTYLWEALGETGVERARSLFPGEEEGIRLLTQGLRSGLDWPLAGGAGRLFDAASALLGVCRENTYEGQAAIELGERVEAPAAAVTERGYPLALRSERAPDGGMIDVYDPAPFFLALLEDLDAGRPLGEMARRVHDGVLDAVEEGLLRAAGETGLANVVLSGGTFQNAYLVSQLERRLALRGLKVHLPERVPLNDGGLALGQAVITRWREA